MAAVPAASRGAFELATTVATLRHLRASDLGPYDAVYVGALFCRQFERSPLEHPDDLVEAVRLLHGQGRRAYLVTYAAPRQDALPVVLRALEAAVAAGLDAVEVHAPGLFRLVRDEFPDLPVHAGTFAGVYTDLGAEVLRGFGVRRVVPGPELALDEVDELARRSGVPVELVVHGKVPLGVSESCLLLPHERDWGIPCPALCQEPLFLRKDGWALRAVGRGVLSGRDVCLLEHLPRLLGAGHRHFRVEAAFETPAYRLAVGQVYREALGRALAGERGLEPAWWPVLGAHAPEGLANGFAFGRSGTAYVGDGAPAGVVRPLPGA